MCLDRKSRPINRQLGEGTIKSHGLSSYGIGRKLGFDKPASGLAKRPALFGIGR
jgi:hypothetical protein